MHCAWGWVQRVWYVQAVAAGNGGSKKAASAPIQLYLACVVVSQLVCCPCR